MPDNEDKDAWVNLGEEYEREFLEEYSDELNISLNPEKEENEYAIDMVREGVKTDLKRQTEPFYTVEDKYGLPADWVVTLNKNDVERYASYLADGEDEIHILFWVTWEDTEDYGVEVEARDGIWKLNLEDIINTEPYKPLCLKDYHIYNNRYSSDPRNSSISYLLDLREMERKV